MKGPNFLTKLMLFMTMMLVMAAVNAEALSPLGKWRTIDDKTHQPRSIVELWMEQGQINGKIEKIFSQPDEQINPLCDKCPEPWHNQKKIGMTILWGFTQNPGNPLQWINGKILDPKTGKIYRCQITLTEDGDLLKVRGYLGLPLLGRTQQWLREPLSAN